MKTVSIILICWMLTFNAIAQRFDEDLLSFNQERNKRTNWGMLSLNTWAVSNITYGSIAYFNSSGESKYFHRMNVFWNVINLGIGIPGFLKNKNEDFASYNFRKTVRVQQQTELSYLINGALDLSYITTGVILREIAFKNADSYHMMRGYGSSFIFQGSFLMVLDVAKYIVHKMNAKKRLSPIWDQVEFSQSGLGLVFHIN